MKILAQNIADNTDLQVYTGKCYFLGAVAHSDCDHLYIYNVETSGSAAAANRVAGLEGSTRSVMLPKPGVECSNGIYAEIDHGQATVYYSLG